MIESRELAPESELQHDLMEARAQLRDMAAVMALPGMWRGRDPEEIAGGLLEVLMAILRADVAFVRLTGSDGETLERWRPQSADRPRLDSYLAGEQEQSEIVTEEGAGSAGPLSLVIKRPLAHQKDAPCVAVASHRPEFPTTSERFLLDFAVEQATIALDSTARLAGERAARKRAEQLVDEQTRLRDELQQQITSHVKLNAALRDVAQERDLALESTRRAEERQRFLAEASKLLDSSHDYELTLQEFANAAVPLVADWCAIHIPPRGLTGCFALAQRNPSKVQLAREIRLRWPSPQTQIPDEPRLLSEITPEFLASIAQDEEHLTMLHALGPWSSGVIVPLKARGRTLGVLTLAMAESGRKFGPQDLDFGIDLAQRVALALDNAELYARAQKARSQAERLQALAQQLNTSLDVDQVLQEVANTAADLLGAPVAGVFLRDAPGEKFELVAGHGLDVATTGPVVLPAHRSVAGQVVASGQAVTIQDVEAAPVSALPQLVSGEAAGSLVVAPIVWRGEPLGVIEVFSPAVSAFSERAGDLLLTLSATAATALQNARAYAGEQRARREAERLQALTRQLAQSITPDDVLDQIAATAAELLDSPVAGVFLLDAEQQVFELVAGRGLDINQRMRLEVRHSLAGTLIHSGRPEVLADVRGAPVTALPKLVSGEAVGSLVVAPIVSRSGPLGAVEVYSSQPGAFEPRHGELLAALAGAAAAVLENAHLYRQRELDLAHLRTIVEQLPVGVMVVDASGLVSLRNMHAELLFGEAIDLQAAARRSSAGLDAGDGTHTNTEPPLLRALRRGEVVTGEHIEIERPDGGRSYLSVNAAPILDESGAIVAAVAVFDDVSGEEELRRQKEQFLAAAAHDLKTPLTSIRGLVQVLERQLGRLDTQEAQRTQPMLTSIQTATRKMTALIDELLDVSRLDATGQLTLNRSETDVVEIARAVIEAQRPGAPEHELELATAIEPLVGWWDGPRLERALANLLGNAVKYSPDGGTVRLEVSLEQEGEAEWAVLSVTDHGIGIPAGDAERIFDRFQRGSNVPQNLAGSGVGLPYVRQVVTQHGGSITVSSQPAENTTFTIRLRRGYRQSVEGARR